MMLCGKLKGVFVTASIACTLLLHGCSTIGPDFNDMTEAYEQAMDMHQKKSLLANMLRASNNLPLIFTDVTTVAGTGAIATSNSIGATIQGVDPGSVSGYFSPRVGSGANISSQLTTNRSFTFSLGSLNNEEFFRGFLTETPLDDMYFFMKSDSPPKEFITALLVDSIETVGKDGVRKEYLNDPTSPRYNQFVSLMSELLEDGLTSEVTNEVIDVGPVLSKEDFAKLLPEISKLLQTKFTFRKVGSQPEGFQISRVVPRAKLCMDSHKETRRYGLHMDCGKPPSSSPDATKQAVRPGVLASRDDSLLIRLRSTRGVFRYLGRVIALQSGPNPVVTTVHVKNAFDQYEDIPILVVDRGNRFSTNDVVVSTNYQGEVFSVPLKNAGYSSRVFELLSVMVTMNKIPGSIPASPGVLIR